MFGVDVNNGTANLLPSPSSTDEPSASVDTSIEDEVMDVDLTPEMSTPADSSK